MVPTITEMDQYLDYFSMASEKHIAVGEGTVNYLRSERAIPNILDFDPQARFIVMVRNPIELLKSYHAQLLRGYDEDIVDLEKAWRKQEERRNGSSVPKVCDDKSKLMYSDIGTLGRQVQRALNNIPSERVKIIVFDDFAKDPKQIYESVLYFLTVPTDRRLEFPVINERKQIKFRRLGLLYREAMVGSWKVKRKLGIKGGLGLLRRLREQNTLPGQSTSLSDAFMTELRNFYKEDVELLSHLLDRDLTLWLGGESVTKGH